MDLSTDMRHLKELTVAITDHVVVMPVQVVSKLKSEFYT